MNLPVLMSTLLLTLFTQNAFGQNSEQQPAQAALESSNEAIGIGAGLLSGVGFIYRKYDTNKNNANHIGGIAYGEKNQAFFSIGLEHLMYIAEIGNSRLAWIMGASNFFKYSKDTVCNYQMGDICSDSKIASYWNLTNVGAGIALEYGDKKGFNIAIELPLTVGIVYEKNKSKSVGVQVLPIPSGMLLFRL